MQPVVEVDHVSKSFGSNQAVQDVSFEVGRGEIFGMLGPNGAGKTTTIRMILDIFKPDQGRIAVMGGALTEEKKDLIGYMPEERGLYQDIPLERCLIYLAVLKGLPQEEAKKRLSRYLEQFDLTDHRKKKVKDLSKGMQQKAQIISTFIHQPELVIIDEPFSGLDPINTQMVKDLILEMRSKGATFIMSTHQMHQVEELCDRIVLINEGKSVLYGNTREIRRRYAGNTILVESPDELPSLPEISAITRQNHGVRLELAPGVTAQEILENLVAKKVMVERFEIAIPSINEIFIRVVSEGKEG